MALKKQDIVITSYSIHYTKLYDGSLKINFKRTNINDIIVEVIELYEAICQSRNITIVNNIGNEHFRITSYNVCYTKLLRIIKTTS